MPATVSFPEATPSREADREVLSFPAIVDGARIRCLVSDELLWERFSVPWDSDAARLQAFSQHKSELQDLARTAILAGDINTKNEVLLTTRDFRLKEATFGDKLRDSGKLFFLARQASETLERLLRGSAGRVTAQWDKAEDAEGRPVVTLRLTDWTGSVTGLFSARELETPSLLRMRLHRLWGDLLQIRSHQQLKELMAVEGAAEK